MIRSQDRSGWFGASDTSTIMGNWNTKTFARFWHEKLGIMRSNFSSPAMIAGSHYEHRILDYLGIAKRDRQVKFRRLRLRVNFDGETKSIHEVKTYKGDAFKVSKAYWQQAQVEMFAGVTPWQRLKRFLLRRRDIHKPLEIVAYRLTEADYGNFYTPIDPDRISHHPIEYDPEWIYGEYLPTLTKLTRCYRRNEVPYKEARDAHHGIHNRS